MPLRTAHSRIAIWTLLILPFAPFISLLKIVSGQQAQQEHPRVRVNSDLVTLSVTVRDRTENLVGDLKREQFHLFDDGVEQKIDVFEEESVPLSLVILIDNDVNGKEGVRMAESLRSLLGGISSQDEAIVCRFDVSFYAGESFSSDLDKLMADVKGAQSEIKPIPKYVPDPLVCGNSTTGPPCIAAPTYAGSRPTKALDDAVFASSELLNTQGVHRRKIILLISDGANEPKLNKHNFESVKETLLYENVSVFSLAIGSDSAKHKFSSMEDYSRLSGGDIYFVSKSRAMEQIYSRITEQARHAYTLAYVPRGNNSDANFHPLELHAEGEGLTVQTREGYYKSLPGKR